MTYADVEIAAEKGVRGQVKLISRSHRLGEVVTPTEVFGQAEWRENFRAFWSQRDGEITLVGLGVAWGVRVSGEGRFQEAREWYRELVANASVEGPDVVGTGPVAIGGFRFDVEAETSPEWAGFGDGIMVVPQVCYAWTPEGRWVTENRIYPANGTDSLLQMGGEQRVDVSVELGEGERWVRAVPGALEAVGRGQGGEGSDGAEAGGGEEGWGGGRRSTG